MPNDLLNTGMENINKWEISPDVKDIVTEDSLVKI